ncbi:MAG TPA: hypothetical protein VIF62_32925, partial [Labilithrix sp.]
LAAGPLATAAQPSGRIVANATHLIWKTPGFTGLQTLAKQGGAVQSFAIGALATNITLYAMSPDGQHLVAANATDRMYVLDTSTPPPWVTKQLLNFPPAPTGISSVAINDSGEIFAGAAADGGPTTSVFYNQDGIGTMWKPLAKPTMASIEVVASSRSGTVFSTDLVTTFFDDVGAGKGSQLTFAPLELAAAETGVAYATASEVGTLDEAPSNKTLTLATNPRDLVLRPNRLHFVSDVGSGQAIQTVTQGTAPVTHVTDTGIVGLAVDNGCFFYWSGGSVRVAGP